MPVASVAIDIGTLITTNPGIHNGCPIVAGTGVTVRRITIDYKMGMSPEEIAQEIPHLTLSQVYAALAYYHTNKDMIEADISCYAAKPDKIALPLFLIFRYHLITISPSFNNLCSNSDNSSTDLNSRCAIYSFAECQTNSIKL